MLEGLFGALNGQLAAQAMNQGNAALQMLKDVLIHMSAANTASAIAANPPGANPSVFNHLGLHIYFKTSSIILLGNLSGPGAFQVTGASTGWPY
jgi:hypothetical protein